MVSSNLLGSYVASRIPDDVIEAVILDKRTKFLEAWKSPCDVCGELRLCVMAEGAPKAVVRNRVESLITKFQQTTSPSGRGVVMLDFAKVLTFLREKNVVDFSFADGNTTVYPCRLHNRQVDALE